MTMVVCVCIIHCKKMLGTVDMNVLAEAPDRLKTVRKRRKEVEMDKEDPPHVGSGAEVSAIMCKITHVCAI